MRTVISRTLLALLLAVASFAGLAQTRQSVVETYFAAVARRDYLAAAQCIQAADLNELSKLLGTVYQQEAQAGQRTLLDATFGKAAGVDDALAARPEERFARLIAFTVNRTASTVGTLRFEDVKLLGEVVENPQLVHVLVRANVRLGSTLSSTVEVVSLAPDGGSWKMVLPNQMRAVAQALQQQLSRRGAR